MFKGILFSVIFIAAAFVSSFNVLAVDVLFEHREREQLSRGVEYERNRMMTSRGMLDVHVLIIDVNEEYISLAPVTSSGTVGSRDTTTRMLADAGAIAGINADFFHLAGTHTVHFGPMVYEGQVIAMYSAANSWRNENATFMLDMMGNPFFRYIQAELAFYNNGQRNIRIGAYNNIGSSFTLPVILDRQVITSTRDLNTRFEDLITVVVDDGYITYISRPGETVTIPQYGYVIVFPPAMNETHAPRLRVGDTARVVIGTDLRIDFSQIQTAIGGGGIILERGEVVVDTGTPTGRHPRSAVGVTRDGRVILMAVDGRSHSVGATHQELAAILRRYGVVDAMHLDGGGSTTLVGRNNSNTLSVLNTPADGAARRVINAFGVFDNSPTGEFSQISLRMEHDRAIKNIPLSSMIIAEDSFGNPVEYEFNINNIEFNNTASGTWDDLGRYTPLTTGLHLLDVQYGNKRATKTIQVYALAELEFTVRSVNLMQAGQINLGFRGTATDGTAVSLPSVTELTVNPSNLGYFNGNTFVAVNGGVGYISATVGNVRQFIPVSIGGFPWPMDMNTSSITFSSYPAALVSGSVNIGTATGRGIPRLDYTFTESTITQAAYINFSPALTIPGENPVGISLNVFGDGSGHWLRGRVRDANGQIHLIDFSRNASFIGWQTVVAPLPANASGPFTIDQVYMVTLGSTEDSRHSIMIDNMEALFAPTSTAVVPQGTVFNDYRRATSSFVATSSPVEFTVPTDTTTYSVQPWSNFAIVNLTAAGGGIMVADINQWNRFMRDIQATTASYVVIMMDYAPRNFASSMEYELFHLAMTTLRDDGRVVFVVSSTGGSSTVLNMRDGIRYIDVARPSEGIPTIRFWTGAITMWSA